MSLLLLGAGSTRSGVAAVSDTIPSLSYQVRGWSISNYFSGPNSAGIDKLGTARLIFKLLSLPPSSQRVICGRVDDTGTNGGWYIATGIASAANTIAVLHRTSTGSKTSPVFTFVAGDVGKHFVLHTTCDGTNLRAYIGGIEVGTGTACGTALSARSTDQLWIGRYQHTSLIASDIAVVSLATSSAVMTAAEIFADASTIQDATGPILVPNLATQVDRFDADDIVSATDWVSTTGSLTLTRHGSVTVETF